MRPTARNKVRMRGGRGAGTGAGRGVGRGDKDQGGTPIGAVPSTPDRVVLTDSFVDPNG